MYKLKFITTKTPLLAHDKIFKKGHTYIVNDAFIGQIVHAADLRGFPEATQDIEVEKIVIPEYRGEDLTGKSILFAREGGAGDLMFMQPAMAHLKNKYDCKVYLMTSPQYLAIASRLPGVDRVFTFPSETMPDVDYICTFINSISYPSFDARNLHAVDLFAKLSHVKLAKTEKKHKVILEPKIIHETRVFMAKLNPKGLKNIVVQFSAQNMNRAYPIEYMLKLIGLLANEGLMVYIIGGKRKYRNEKGEVYIGPECPVEFKSTEGGAVENIQNLTGKANWERSMGLIHESDLFIGPDSSGVHLAGAWGKKQIGLYAPFSPEVRMLHYDNATAITPTFIYRFHEGEKVRYIHDNFEPIECSRVPCFVHRSTQCSKFNTEFGSVCWKNVKPELVFSVVQELLSEEDLCIKQ